MFRSVTLIRNAALLVLSMFVLQACVLGTRVDEMSASSDGLDFPEAYLNNVRVAVVSSNTTRFAAWTPEVTPSNFEAALVQSLKSAGLYSAEGQYELQADVMDIDQPLAGTDMTVSFDVDYVLVRAGEDVPEMASTIASEHTATVSDDFIGEARLREAAEQAAKENISRLLAKLAVQD